LNEVRFFATIYTCKYISLQTYAHWKRSNFSQLHTCKSISLQTYTHWKRSNFSQLSTCVNPYLYKRTLIERGSAAPYTCKYISLHISYAHKLIEEGLLLISLIYYLDLLNDTEKFLIVYMPPPNVLKWNHTVSKVKCSFGNNTGQYLHQISSFERGFWLVHSYMNWNT
jgi:hypothetical protein